MSKQKDMERLSQQEIAALVGVTTRTIRDWGDHRVIGENNSIIPRNRDGTYHSQAVMWWVIANKKQVGGGHTR